LQRRLIFNNKYYFNHFDPEYQSSPAKINSFAVPVGHHIFTNIKISAGF